MAYLSYSTGFKSGGTNTDRIWFFLPQLFAAETSKSIELGFKGDLGERFRVAVALYQTDFEDFQANSFTGTGFNLQNAGDLEVKGIEIEWMWQPLDNTTVSGYFAHNEGDFKTFELGTCWDSSPFHTLTPDPGLNPATGTCSRSGEAIPYNPEDRFNVGVTQTFPMRNNELFLRAEYAWASEQLTDGDNDPLTKQDDFGILNLRVGYNIESWNSSITLWGRNVTDERYFGGSFDPPLARHGPDELVSVRTGNLRTYVPQELGLIPEKTKGGRFSCRPFFVRMTLCRGAQGCAGAAFDPAFRSIACLTANSPSASPRLPPPG